MHIHQNRNIEQGGIGIEPTPLRCRREAAEGIATDNKKEIICVVDVTTKVNTEQWIDRTDQ